MKNEAMKRTTIYLPIGLAERLRVAAFERRESAAEIIRRAVERELKRPLK